MTAGFSSAIGQFVIGQSPIQGYLQPPVSNGNILRIIPAYLYEEYQDDPDLQAFFRAYNELAQEYLDWFNGTPLAIYTLDAISGALLDWVGAGVYGIPRPSLSAGTAIELGPLNTYAANVLGPNETEIIASTSFAATPDDIYKRVLTWNFYKGDGNRFTIAWLKRRVLRFLTGTNGASPPIDETYSVSVSFAGGNTVYIVIASDSFAPELIAALTEGINAKVLQTPFQYNFAVLSGGSGFGEFAFGISAFGG